MKILFLNQFFWPDSSATSQQLGDLASGLAARGHEVTVLCGGSGYAAAGSAQPPAGVHIQRVPTAAFARGKAGRVLSYLSFLLFAPYRALRMPRQDLVVSMTTPPLLSLLGELLKTVRGAAHVIYEQDLYPDVAVDLGTFRRGGPLDRTVGALADFGRRRADGIIALGECMRARLHARGIAPERIAVAENWASSALIRPMPRPGNPNELVLLYSGNLGLAHELDTLRRSMLALRDDPQSAPRFRFLFVGAGARRQELQDFCTAEGIAAAEFRPYVPRDQLSEGLALGDIGVVTQHEVACGSVVPSKVYGIMAAARPILFIGPRAATPALVIARHRCGWQIDPGDDLALTALLQHLAHAPDEVREAGQRAHEALLAHYDLPGSIDRIASLLLRMSGSIPGSVPHTAHADTVSP